MLKFCLKKYFEAYGEFLCSEANDSRTKIDSYLYKVKKEARDSRQYKGWGRQSKITDSIHGHWEWYRPLANFIIERHYNKHMG
jgi:hypothetical protein